MTYSAEVEPLGLLKALYEADWNTYSGRVPRPLIHIVLLPKGGPYVGIGSTQLRVIDR